MDFRIGYLGRVTDIAEMDEQFASLAIDLICTTDAGIGTFDSFVPSTSARGRSGRRYAFSEKDRWVVAYLSSLFRSVGQKGQCGIDLHFSNWRMDHRLIQKHELAGNRVR